jgi:hypothetical protein
MRDQLIRVAVAARKEAAARERLHVEIREAREQGQPLRKIAAEAGLSYETVRRICES